MRALCTSLVLSFIPTLATADVFVVDSAGGGDFLDLQPAVDAAADGDLVLVRTGTYGTFAIADRSITVVADQGASVEIQGAVRVRNLSANRTAVLSGLTATGTGLDEPQRYGLFLVSNAGHVRIQDCTFVGSGGVPNWNRQGFAAAVARDCADVSFDACSLTGGAAGGGDVCCSPPVSGAGLRAENSTVTLSGGSSWGGSAIDLEPYGSSAGWDGGYGGAGLVASSSTVLVSGAVLRGGDGGNAAWFAPLYGIGGDGGDGAQADSSLVYVQDSPTIAGNGGWGTQGSIYWPPNDGPPGQSRVGAQFVDWAGIARTLVDAGGPVREGMQVALQLQAPAGDVAALGIETSAGYAFRSSAGAWLLDAPAPPDVAKFLILGTVSALEILPWSYTVPELGPGVDARVRHVQVQCVDGPGTRFLTGARVLIMLDQAY